MTEPTNEGPRTLDEKLADATAYFKNKFQNEIEHIKRVHPEARAAATIIRVVGGGYLAVYDFDKSDEVPAFIVGINPNDWALMVTAYPDHGLALPVPTWSELEERVMAGVVTEHETEAAKVEA